MIGEGKRGGRPSIRGWRIRVTEVLDLLAAGAAIDATPAGYPVLERENILAAVEYAARRAGHPSLKAA